MEPLKICVESIPRNITRFYLLCISNPDRDITQSLPHFIFQLYFYYPSTTSDIDTVSHFQSTHDNKYLSRQYHISTSTQSTPSPLASLQAQLRPRRTKLDSRAEKKKSKDIKYDIHRVTTRNKSPINHYIFCIQSSLPIRPPIRKESSHRFKKENQRKKRKHIENTSPETGTLFPPKGMEFARGAVSFFFQR